ncbi:MAG: cytochrome c oxidase assembly protein [Gammaproteobacteria bacterium]
MPERKSHGKLIFGVLSVVFGMLLFAFALVPLYDVFCEMTGINDKGGRVRAEVPTEIDTSRSVRIKFITHVISDIPFEFKADEVIIDIHPGEVKKMIFHVNNPVDKEVSGTFVATVSPGFGARYVKKTECFSFDRQEIAAYENKPMSVVFFIDKDLPKDVKELTLFYTLYNTPGA